MKTSALRHKRGGHKRMRLKRAREWVYLSHFLATGGISPQKIISGADDGKEPDFTCIIDGKLIGIELTTLPRLRDHMGSKYLWFKRWYWRLQAFLRPNRYPLKPKQLRRLVRLQARKNLLQQPLPVPQKQALRLYQQKTAQYVAQQKQTNSLHSVQYGKPNHKKPPTSSQSKKVRSKRAAILKMLDFSEQKAQITKLSKLNKSYAGGNNPSVSYMTQADIDAVMGKKAHKVAAYNRRRKLDEIWLLIHTDYKQPSEVLYFPKHTVSHASDFDRVWLTSYPLVHAYPVLAYKPASEKQAA